MFGFILFIFRLPLVLWCSVTLRREIFLLSEDFISRLSVTGVWGQRPRSKSEQPSRDDNNLGFRRGWAVFDLSQGIEHRAPEHQRRQVFNSLRSAMWRSPLLFLFIFSAWSADKTETTHDPYAIWGHGRPHDAIAPLIEHAKITGRWDAWLDAALAAAAAEQTGDSIAYALIAHQLAPHETAPRQTLKSLNASVFPGWSDRLGPLAIPGSGLIGVIILSLGALLLGFCLTGKKYRLATGIVGIFLLLIALPGRFAFDHDSKRGLLSAVRASILYDTTGAPTHEIPLGTVVRPLDHKPWAGRLLVETTDNKRGFIPLVDVTPNLVTIVP
jgi:hypothetical protein